MLEAHKKNISELPAPLILSSEESWVGRDYSQSDTFSSSNTARTQQRKQRKGYEFPPSSARLTNEGGGPPTVSYSKLLQQPEGTEELNLRRMYCIMLCALLHEQREHPSRVRRSGVLGKLQVGTRRPVRRAGALPCQGSVKKKNSKRSL